MNNIVKLDYVFFQMDGNGTTVIGDTTKEMNTLISEVAGVIKGIWDEHHPEMTYKDYIQKVVHPGNKHDKEVKVLQEKKIGSFLEYLGENNHPLHVKAFKLYQDLAKDYLDAETQSVKFTVFPSIMSLIHKVKSVCPFSLTLRTFGKDGPVIAKEFQKCGLEMKRHANMIDGGIQLGGEEKVVTGPEMLKVLQEDHTIGQDQVQHWFANGRTAGSGKIIPCVEDAQFENRNVVTIFLDDNVNIPPRTSENELPIADPAEPNIAFPQDIYGRPTSWHSRGIIGIKINPVKAALQEDYVVKKVNKELAKRGFMELK